LPQDSGTARLGPRPNRRAPARRPRRHRRRRMRAPPTRPSPRLESMEVAGRHVRRAQGRRVRTVELLTALGLWSIDNSDAYVRPALSVGMKAPAVAPSHGSQPAVRISDDPTARRRRGSLRPALGLFAGAIPQGGDHRATPPTTWKRPMISVIRDLHHQPAVMWWPASRRRRLLGPHGHPQVLVTPERPCHRGAGADGFRYAPPALRLPLGWLTPPSSRA